MLKRYEAHYGANDSTYWIYFELLWREYFYWYARRYGRQLFHFGGIRNQTPLTSFYAHRFQQWKKARRHSRSLMRVRINSMKLGTCRIVADNWSRAALYMN